MAVACREKASSTLAMVAIRGPRKQVGLSDSGDVQVLLGTACMRASSIDPAKVNQISVNLGYNVHMGV